MFDDDVDETGRCPECESELQAVFLQVLGVSIIRYQCRVHGVNAFQEFLT
jgi:hypothetical protein